MDRKNGFVSRLVGVAFAVAIAVLPVTGFAQVDGGADPPGTSWPTNEFNVNIAEFVPLILQAFAVVVAAVDGGYFLIQLVRGGMAWARRYTTK